MGSTIPQEILIVALLLAAARLLMYGIGYCLLRGTQWHWEMLVWHGQLIVAMFLCCGAVMAFLLTHLRLDDSYIREAESSIFVSLMVAEVRLQVAIDILVHTDTKLGSATECAKKI